MVTAWWNQDKKQAFAVKLLEVESLFAENWRAALDFADGRCLIVVHSDRSDRWVWRRRRRQARHGRSAIQSKRYAFGFASGGGVGFDRRIVVRMRKWAVHHARILRCNRADRRMRKDIQQHPLPLFPYPEHPAGRLHFALAQAVDTDVERNRPFHRLDNVPE